MNFTSNEASSSIKGEKCSFLEGKISTNEILKLCLGNYMI